MQTVTDYTAILATLHQVAPEAHIVRDTILQKPIHDIDVFMSDEHVDEAAVILRSACQYVKTGEWKQYLGFSGPAMTRVAKFEKHDMTIPVCVIGLEDYVATPNANLARFDFGCCMAAFDGVRTIRSQEFDRDVKAQTFTLHRADSQAQFDYSMTRFEKITTGRYKGWSLVIPSEFAEYVKERAFHRDWYEDRDLVKGLGGESVLKPKERRPAWAI